MAATQKPFWKTTPGILLGCVGLAIILVVCSGLCIGILYATGSLDSLQASTKPTLAPAPTLRFPITAPSGGIITDAVLAKDVRGDNFEPTGIADSFPQAQSIYHAVVTLKEAPKGTAVKVIWLTSGNSKFGEFELKSEGTRNLDFSFTPDKGGLVPGDYRVEVYLNGRLDRTLKFSVTGQAAPPPATAPSSSAACQPPVVQTTAPGFAIKITMAQGTQGDAKDPVGATTTFSPNATFHAVVNINNAPNATKFGAAWFATDTGGAAPCNSAIDSTTLEAGGTRNIDFSLTPSAQWPAGTYQVQIIVNGKVAAVQSFNVK